MSQEDATTSRARGPGTKRRRGFNVAIAAQRMGVSESTVRRWIRTGRLNPRCAEVYARVDRYLDHELTEDEQAEVQRHLEACPGCESHFRFDGTVLRWVQARAAGGRSPEPAVGRIMDRFRSRVGQATSDRE